MSFNKNNVDKYDVTMQENSFSMNVIGDDVPYLYLDEQTKEVSKRSFLRICRENENGEKYWESVKPYEVIDGKLCIRSKGDHPLMTGWIVLTKEELKKLLKQM